MGSVGWIVVALVAGLFLVAGLWWPWQRARRQALMARAEREFHRQRERLEARFLQLAGNSGKPRGLRWTNCDFEDAVTYAWERRSGELLAFVGVTISFEAIAGGPMEDVEAVSNLRAATALFRYRQSCWQTDGRAVFNLNPSEAIAYYHTHVESVGRPAIA